MKKLLLISLMLLAIFIAETAISNVCFATDYTQDANCQAAWLFTEGSGTTVTDDSGNGNTANFKGLGEPAWDSGDIPESYCSNSVHFDKTDDYIDTGMMVDTRDNWTVVGWIKPDDLSLSGTYQNWWGAHLGNQRFYGGLAKGSPTKYFLGVGANWKATTQNLTISAGTWFHWALVLDSGTARYYVNGIEVDTLSYTGAEQTRGTNLIGARRSNGSPYNPQYFFDGRMTEVALFDRALDSSEINEIMNSGLKGSGGEVPSGDIPQIIRFQAGLEDAEGASLDGTFDLTFKLYDSETGGIPIWEELQQDVVVEEGVLDVKLGSETPIALPFDKQYWLGVEVEADGEMTPRFEFTTVPYSFKLVQ